MVPLAILGSIGMSLAVKVGIGLVASAAKALLDAGGASTDEAGKSSQAPPSFAAHLERAGSGLPAPTALPALGPQAALMPPDTLSRLAFEGGSRALALGAQFRADTPRVLGMASPTAPRPAVHSFRA